MNNFKNFDISMEEPCLENYSDPPNDPLEEFTESCWLIIKLVPLADKISCTLKEFGYSSTEKHFDLDKTQVLEVLRHFLDEVIQLAVEQGYIRQEDKAQFLSPTFPNEAQPTGVPQGSGV